MVEHIFAKQKDLLGKYYSAEQKKKIARQKQILQLKEKIAKAKKKQYAEKDPASEQQVTGDKKNLPNQIEVKMQPSSAPPDQSDILYPMTENHIDMEEMLKMMKSY